MSTPRAADSTLSVQPIFIVGVPRSGTTLTATILGRHPDVVSPGESHFFEQVWQPRAHPLRLPPSRLHELATQTFGLLGNSGATNSQEWLESRYTVEDLVARAKALGGSPPDLYRAFLDLLSSRTGGRFVCDDTPRHLFHIRELWELFPGAPIIGLVRDPRDFLASYKNYGKVAKPAQQARLRTMYHPLLTSLYWQSAANELKRLRRGLSASTFVILRYEELVAETETQVRTLCHRLGLSYDPDLLNVDRNNSSYQRDRAGIFSTSVGCWQQHLDPAEAWICQTVCRHSMSEFEYVPATLRPSWLAVVRLVLSAPIGMGRAVWSNRHRTTSLGRLLFDRARALLRG